MHELTSLASFIPVGALVPTTMLLIVGLILWGAGSRVLRVGFAALGMIFGAALGWIFAESVLTSVPGWVVALPAAGLLALLAAMTYRTAVAASLAAVLGLAAPLAVWTIAEIGGEVAVGPRESLSNHFAQGAPDGNDDDPNGPLASHEPGDEEFDEISGWLQDASDRLRDARAEVEGIHGDHDDENAVATASDTDFDSFGTSAQTFMKVWMADVARGAGELWAQTPNAIRPTMSIAAIVGILLGAMLGVLAPSMWAGTVTAFGGAMLWLFSARTLMELAQLDTAWLPHTARNVVLLWVAVAIIGLSIQWTIRPRRADKPGWFGRRPSTA